MKILVTGGAGFIGANLVRKLLVHGHDVTILDDFSTGRAESVPEGVRCLRGDVQGIGYLMGLDGKTFHGPFRQIYHLACPASPPQYMKDPTRTLGTAFNGTAAVLSYARATHARVLVASTSEVYGEPLEHPQSESNWSHVNTLGPRACYDLGKAAAEALVSAAWSQHNQNVVMARIFNTYGPFMDPGDGRVVSNFICQALRNEPVTVYGGGGQTRSFCYVDDLVNGLIAAMVSNKKDVYNLGNSTERTISFMAARIITMARSKSEIVLRPLPGDDPTRRKPDIAKAERDLRWSPSVGIEDGLAATIEYFRKEIAQ